MSVLKVFNGATGEFEPVGGFGLPAAPVSFKAHPLVGTEIPTGGAGAIISFGAIDHDSDGYFDTTLSRYTPKVPGLYLVRAIVSVDNMHIETDQGIIILKNGAIAERSFTRTSSSAYNSAEITALIEMNGTSDYLECKYIQFSGTTKTCSTIAAATNFQAVLVQQATQRVPITISAEYPSGGRDGDIWIKYIP